MKLFVLAAAMAFSVQSFAVGVPADFFAVKANMVHIYVDPGHASQPIDQAIVMVNEPDKKINLQLINSSALFPIRDITLPLVEVKPETGCSGTEYIARQDLRIADGSLNEIRVLDRSTMVCEIFVPGDQLTRVIYTTVTSGFSPLGVETFKSEFAGEKLSR